jgi:hypothetical protein
MEKQDKGYNYFYDKELDKVNWINVTFSVIMLLSIVYFLYEFSDSGRLKRDYGFYSSGISDNEVRAIWCGMQGFEELYKEVNEREYCGEVEVEMDCIFSNSGDYCSIKQKGGLNSSQP